jgi:hypothetical protein
MYRFRYLCDIIYKNIIVGVKMNISYNPLWEKLKEKNISRTELREAVKLGSSTYSKLVKNQSVTTDTLLKISTYLCCDVSELIESGD